MKKFILLSFFCLVISSPLFAEKTTEVSMRSGRQENTVRIVLEADEDFIKNANTVTSLSAVKIEFPGQFELKKPKDFIFETTKTDRMLLIQLKEVVDIKTRKLSAPARLVIDLTTAPKKPQEPQQKPGAGLQENMPKDQQKPGTEVPAKTQTPLTQPAEKVRKLKVFVIDAGHGGYDLGLTAKDFREKDVTLTIAKDLGTTLSKKGFTAHLTRKADLLLPLSERISFANSKNPDMFISIHCSSSDNRFAIYVSTYEEMNVDAAVRLYSLFSRQDRFVEKSRTFAKALADILRAEFKADVVIRELPLPVLNSMNAPAVMVEVPGMKAYASDQKTRDRLVNSLLAGINTYDQ